MSNTKFSFNLSSYAFIDIEGEDSEKFLQGQLTINAETPRIDTAYLSALCNHKGRVVSLFFISKLNYGYRLFMPHTLITPTLTHLKKYSPFFKVKLVRSSNQTQLVGTVNQCSFVNNNDLKNQQLVNIANTQLSILVISDRANDEKIVASLIKDQKDDSEWYFYLAQNKIPWITEESVEQFLPHDLNLPKLAAVDFNKGCYTGQEVIARMHYKGKLKQRLQLLEGNIQDPILSNSHLFQRDKKLGTVICGLLTKKKSGLLLAIVKDTANFDDNFHLEDKNTSILKIVK